MTVLKLDERQPLVVIVGDFNPAIFTVLWVARHLHGFEEGAEVPVIEMVAELPAGVAQFAFIEGVALIVTSSRLEAYVLSQEDQRLEALERVLTRLVQVLPHTPLRGIGCNFQYRAEDSSDRLLALFDSPEGLEGEFSVTTRGFTVQLELVDALLNLSRAQNGATVQFSFNYHHSEHDPEAYIKLLPGLVRRSREHSIRLLASVYGLSEYEPLSLLPLKIEESSDGPSSNEHSLVKEHNR